MSNLDNFVYNLFISFAQADRAWVNGLLLPALGPDATRILTPEQFRPGASIVNEFERAVQTSRHTLLVLSPAYLADEWTNLSEQFVSFLSTAEGQTRVIPLLKEPCDLPLRLNFRVQLDCTTEENTERSLARLRELLNAPVPQAEQIPCPYPGMVPFRAEDAKFFFGRDAEIDEMVRRLRGQNVLYVIGPSGSGKSSLVFAGLVVELQKRQPDKWLVRSLRPGNAPLDALRQAVGDVLDLKTYKPVGLQSQRLLLVIDQFEELFAQNDKPTQTEFIAALKRLEKIPECALVITMGAAFYPDLMTSDLWPLDTSERIELAPLRGEQLAKAIRQPAEKVGVYLEAGLVERLVADAAADQEPGVLPLVQETMVLLWEKRERRLLTQSAYTELGRGNLNGLSVALATKADSVYLQLSEPQREIARRIFLRLVQLGEGRPDTRRQQTVSQLHGKNDDARLFEQTLTLLANNRLLTLEGKQQDQNKLVDISHEALIRGWPRLREWIEKNRLGLEIHRRLSEASTLWIQKGKSQDNLYRGTVLKEVSNWQKTHPVELNQTENAFLSVSRRMERQRKIVFSSATFGVIFLLGAIGALALTGWLNRIWYQPLQMQWATIPAGDFLMGTSEQQADRLLKACPVCDIAPEKPQHQVYLDEYRINQFEVTNKEYLQCVRAGICPAPQNTKYDKQEFENHPVTHVSWNNAALYCQWTGAHLPTDAQWEKAARGFIEEIDNTRTYPWGDEWDPQRANVFGNGVDTTMSVGSFSPRGDSPYGVADMSGNVWEWVADWYAVDYYTNSPAYNPTGPAETTSKVLRGGSFMNSPEDARVSSRASYSPGFVSDDIGFRCVR